MARAKVTLRLFGGEDKPARRHAVSLQVFSLSRGGWIDLARDATGDDGRLSLALDDSLIGEAAAPAMRLVEPGDPAPRVLGAPAMIQVSRRGPEGVLLVDFGEIELLRDSAYERQISEAGFRPDAGAVAGAPRKPGLSQMNVLLNLDRSAMLRNAVSANSLPPGGLTVNADRAGGTPVVSEGGAAEPSAASAPAVSRELGEARALLLQKESALADRDREILNRVTELEAVRDRVAHLESSLSEARSRAELAEREAAELKAEAREPAEVTTVLTGLGSKLADANQALQGGAVPFRLGAIKVDLRGRMTRDGTGIVMGENIRDGSGFSAEFHVDTPRRGDSSDVSVPDCTGLTPTAAGRVLRSVGLRLRPAEQRLAEGRGTPGQALTQHPGPGRSAPHGTEVLVVFGTRPGADE